MTQFLNDFETFVKDHGYKIFRVGVIKDGKQAERTLFPLCNCLNSYSIGKAFVVTAIFMLYDEGKLTTDMTLQEALGEEYPENAHPAYADLTLHQILKHRLGLPGGYLDIDAGDAYRFGNDYLAYTLSTPPIETPGTVECYTDAAYYLLSRVVDHIAAEPIEHYLWHKLFAPLVFREVAWSHCPQNHAMGATGLYLHTGDMVKLGEIYLSGGLYEGKRYLSEEAVATVLSKEYEFHPMAGGKAFGKGGMNGQMLMVVPAAHRVIAWHAYEPSDFSPLIEFAANYQD